MVIVASRRQAPRRRSPHLTVVLDEAQPGLWDSPELVAAELGLARPGPCFGYADIDGAQRSLVVVLSHAGKKYAVVVLIDYLLGGGVKDCYLTGYTSKLRDEYRRVAADPDLRFSDLDGETTREILEQALSREPCPVEPDQIQDVGEYLDLVRTCAELLPRGPAAPALAAAPRPDARGSLPQHPGMSTG